MKYVLELDETQAIVTLAALNFFSRVKSGQWDEITELCLTVKPGEIAEYCWKKDELNNGLRDLRKIAFPDLKPCNPGRGVMSDESAGMAWEILEVLRHCMAWTEHPEGGMTVDFREPVSLSGNKLCKCKAVIDDE